MAENGEQHTDNEAIFMEENQEAENEPDSDTDEESDRRLALELREKQSLRRTGREDEAGAKARHAGESQSIEVSMDVRDSKHEPEPNEITVTNPENETATATNESDVVDVSNETSDADMEQRDVGELNEGVGDQPRTNVIDHDIMRDHDSSKKVIEIDIDQTKVNEMVETSPPTGHVDDSDRPQTEIATENTQKDTSVPISHRAETNTFGKEIISFDETDHEEAPKNEYIPLVTMVKPGYVYPAYKTHGQPEEMSNAQKNDKGQGRQINWSKVKINDPRPALLMKKPVMSETSATLKLWVVMGGGIVLLVIIVCFISIYVLQKISLTLDP